MSQKVINTSMPNDGLGDALRDAFNDTNDNFTELYATKVDKVVGKDLSDNNLTDELLVQIYSHEDGSQKNVQSDWGQDNSLEDDFIKNKPDSIAVKAPSKVNISFDFPTNSRTDLDSIHGTFLINNSEDGIILNPGTPIAGTGGVSKVMAVVLAGTVLTGDLIISGIKVDRVTGIETPGSTETIPIDGLSTNNSTVDSNGNPVHSYENNYISVDWWKGPLVFSTPDLDLTEIRFAQIAFEQFNDVEDLVIDSLDATYKISNTGAIMDAYLYAVQVEGNMSNVTMISELHHASGEEVDAVFRKKQKDLNYALDGRIDGVFIDLFLAPPTQNYFTNFTMKVWATINIPIDIFIDNSLITESIIYGEALNAGENAYLALDGKYYKADNTDEATSTTQIRLILNNGILDDERKCLVKGNYQTTGLTAGNEYLGTAGGFVSTIPTGSSDVVRIISTAVTVTKRYFNPDNTWILGDGSNINGVDLLASTETVSDAWSVGGLDVRAYATNAPILDQFYTAEAQTITINPAPTTPDYLRYIAIVMDTSGVITAQDGAEGLAVLPPGVDTDNYYLIRYLLIAFGDTEPSDENGNETSTFDLLYNEVGTEAGGESDVSTNSGTITINEAGSPFGGVGIRAVNPPLNGTAKIDFTHTAKRLFSDLTGLNFNFQLDEFNNRLKLFVEFYSGSVRVANIRISTGNYGFSNRDISGQNVNIPKEFLRVINTEYDSVRIYLGSPSGTIAGYWIDNVQLLNAYASNPNNPETPQIQSDWNQTDENKIDYIKNKPANVVESVVAGTNVTVDNTDPKNPIVSSTGGGSTIPVSKTGTSIVFTEDAFYNEITYLTSGDLTLDLTGAVKGSVIMVFCNNYIPILLGEEYKVSNGFGVVGKLNIYSFLWDGTQLLLNIGNFETNIALTDLVSYWDAFDDSTVITANSTVTLWKDKSGRGNDLASSVNLPSHSSANNEVSFIGVQASSFKQLSKIIPIVNYQQTDDFSVLIKGLRMTSNGGAPQHIINNKNSVADPSGWSVQTNGSGSTLYFTHQSGVQNLAGFTITSFLDDVKRDFIFINESGVLKIYDDTNTNVGTTGSTVTGAITYSGNYFKLGTSELNGVFNPFNGSLGVVKVWKKALNNTERNTELGL